MNEGFKIRGKVWVWPGVGGWHFVYVDKKLSEKIGNISKPYKYGSGFVAIKAKLGKTVWETALFPHKKEGVYLISIKASVRKKEQIYDGDEVLISFNLRTNL